MKKRRIKAFVATLLAVVCLLSAVSAASAVEPRLTGIINFNTSLTIDDNGIAKCRVSSALNTTTYTGTLVVKLQRSGNGSSWSTAKIWTASRNNVVSIAQDYYVASGYYYRLQCTVTVFDADGNTIGTNSKISSTVYRG